jgi:nucleotide-binding universal stress UspA family protein
MKPIMLATDGSPTAEEATKKAIELAKFFDTELYIVTAWDIPYSSLGYAAVPPVGDLVKVSKDRADEVTAEAARRAKDAGLEVKTFVLRGFPVDEIIIAAKKFSPQLVVLGSHGWGPVKRAIFGSVSTGVLHHATCPVLVVPLTHPDGTEEKQKKQLEAVVGS